MTDRLLELLIARATEGLSETEQHELELLLERDPAAAAEGEELELAAALADRAFAEQKHARGIEAIPPMPEDLARRILARAPTRPVVRTPEAPSAKRFALGSLGWYAAAAVLLLALWVPWRSAQDPTPPPTAPDQARRELLASAADAIRVAWATPALPEYAGVTGDVVWSDERQAGFLRLAGLPANSPTEAQYQLWIVDPDRDEHPIDGGVFDVPAGGGELVVPIDAKLRADDPQVFAITLEQPGGVVVSDGPLLVVASVGSG